MPTPMLCSRPTSRVSALVLLHHLPYLQPKWLLKGRPNRVSLNLFQERAKEKTRETNVYIVLLDQWLRLPPRPTGLRRHLVLLACVRHQEPCNSKLGRTRVHRMVFSHSLRKLCLAYPSFLLLSLLGLNSSLLELVQPSDVFVATSLQCITEACLVVLRAESLKLLPKDY